MDKRDETYKLITKWNIKTGSQNSVDTRNYFWRIRRKDTKECVYLDICLNCKDVLSYKIKNGLSSPHSNLDACQLNKTATNDNAGDIWNTLFKATLSKAEKKDTTKSCVVYSALDLRPFFAIFGKGFKGLLTVCMNISQNKIGKIDVDDLLPHPNTASCNIPK